MRRALALSFIVLAACQSSVVAPPSTSPVVVSDAHLRTVLATRHFDADADAVRALGEGAAPMLIAIADGESEAPVTRIRAVLAMRHQSTDAVKRTLVRIATTASLPALRRSSIDSLSRAFASRDPHLVIETCEGLRTHEDESVRRAAIEAEMRARVRGVRSTP